MTVEEGDVQISKRFDHETSGPSLDRALPHQACSEPLSELWPDAVAVLGIRPRLVLVWLLWAVGELRVGILHGRSDRGGGGRMGCLYPGRQAPYLFSEALMVGVVKVLRRGVRNDAGRTQVPEEEDCLASSRYCRTREQWLQRCDGGIAPVS